MQQEKNLAQHPARAKLDTMSRGIPKEYWRAMEEFHLMVPPALSQEFVGIEEAGQAFINAIGADNFVRFYERTSDIKTSNAITTYLTLATWRLSQGIYRFDEDIYSAVVDTIIEGDIPGELLLKLPERCVYVETPGLVFTFTDETKSPILGIWARVESVPNTAQIILVLQPLVTTAVQDSFMHSFRVPLWESMSQWVKLANDNNTDMIRSANGAQDSLLILRRLEITKTWVMPALNLLLYLCSANSEIGDGSRRPNDVTPKLTKKGPRLFPASTPTKWDVGVRLGAALRASQKTNSVSSTSGSASEKRPHIRRAHWHSVRLGAMKHADGTKIPNSQRKLELHWYPPIPVKIESIDDLPSTIRLVV